MTVIEGYSEHVMDAIGERLDPSYARLRRLADAQRERQSLLDAVVGRLLGLDMKLRQYRLGKRFADRVAEDAGIEGLNEVWRAPEALPSGSELEDPERWLTRVAAA
jgi:putative hydrolase